MCREVQWAFESDIESINQKQIANANTLLVDSLGHQLIVSFWAVGCGGPSPS